MNGSGNIAEITILSPDKIDYKTKTVTSNKEGHYIIIKGTIQQEDITTVNVYVPNVEASKYIRQQIISFIKEVINTNRIIVGDVNTPLTSMDRSSKQKINKETVALNDTLDLMDLTDTFRAFQPK